MNAPVAPARFAHPADVAARFTEGTIPPELLTTSPPGWVQLRIEDIEADLIGLVPSLADPVDDAVRARRVKTLVCDKVLDLRRNPQRYSQTTQQLSGNSMSETFSYGGVRGEARATISFTEEELERVRLVVKRSRFGTVPLAPGLYHRSRTCW